MDSTSTAQNTMDVDRRGHQSCRLPEYGHHDDDDSKVVIQMVMMIIHKMASKFENSASGVSLPWCPSW